MQEKQEQEVSLSKRELSEIKELALIMYRNESIPRGLDGESFNSFCWVTAVMSYIEKKKVTFK